MDSFKEKVEDATNLTVESRASFTQLLYQAQELIDKLLNLKLDSITGSETQLQDSIKIIIKLEEEYIKQGTDGILNKIANAITKIDQIKKRSTEISSVLNIDITDCISGQSDQLENLGKNIVLQFTEEAKTVINNAVEKVNNNKKIITDFTEEISGLPAKLSSSIITWNPGPVIKEFIDHVTDLASKIPDAIGKMIADAQDIMNELPSELLLCVTDTVKRAEEDANNMLKIIAGNISIKFGEAIIEYLLK